MIAFALVLGALLTNGVASAAPAGSDRLFANLVLDRFRAYGKGDVRAYARLLDADFIHISDLGTRRTAKQMPAYVRGHDLNRASYALKSLAWHIVGNLALVDAEVAEHQPETDGVIRESDVFAWHTNRWLYLHHQETEVFQIPRASAVLDASLRDYVGTYRTPRGTIDVITLEKATLFDRTLPGADAEPLVPIARGAFGFIDDPTFAVFVRDASGRVTHCLWHLPSGQTTVSQRTAGSFPQVRKAR